MLRSGKVRSFCHTVEFAGEPACATNISRVPAKVGQALSPANSARRQFFLSFSELF